MKFTYFHLMPFDGIPDDFASRFRSVWVDIPPTLMDVRKIHHLYNDYLDEIEYAAVKGFDAVGVNEHHASAYGMMSSPNMMAPALAWITDTAAKLLVCDAVPCTTRRSGSPRSGVLDVMSGGRLITGFRWGAARTPTSSTGSSRRRCASIPRGLDLVMKAWTSDEVFAHNGRYGKLRYVNLWPAAQKPPAGLVPGSGSIETTTLAIEFPPISRCRRSTSSYARVRQLRRQASMCFTERETMVADPDEERLVMKPVLFFQRGPDLPALSGSGGAQSPSIAARPVPGDQV